MTFDVDRDEKREPISFLNRIFLFAWSFCDMEQFTNASCFYEIAYYVSRAIFSAG